MHLSWLKSLSWSLAFTLLSAGAARAESPPSVCQAGWWVDDATHPLAVDQAPTEPWVLLPIQWIASYGAQPLPADLAPPILTVTVTDGSGATVSGVVALRGDSASPPIRALARVLRWRPNAPLTLGASYSVRVTVPAAPIDGPYTGCNFAGVDRTLSLSVAATPPPAPTVSVRVTTQDYRYALNYALCSGVDDEIACADHPEVCCLITPTQAMRVTFELSEAPPNEGRYHAIGVTASGLGTEAPLWVVYPANPGEGHGSYSFPVDAASGPPAPDSLCAEVTLYELFTDAVVATGAACADPADHVAAPPASDDACEPIICAAFAPVSGPEPQPEASAELGMADDVSGGDAYGDASAGSDLVPNGAPEASGCAGGGHVPVAFALLALLALAVGRRRARGRLR